MISKKYFQIFIILVLVLLPICYTCLYWCLCNGNFVSKLKRLLKKWPVFWLFSQNYVFCSAGTQYISVKEMQPWKTPNPSWGGWPSKKRDVLTFTSQVFMRMLYFPRKSCLKINYILPLSHFRASRTKMEASVWINNLKLNFQRKICLENRYLFMCECVFTHSYRHCILSNYHMYSCISVSNFLTLTKFILNLKLKFQTSVWIFHWWAFNLGLLVKILFFFFSCCVCI